MPAPNEVPFKVKYGIQVLTLEMPSAFLTLKTGWEETARVQEAQQMKGTRDYNFLEPSSPTISKQRFKQGLGAVPDPMDPED